MEITNFRSFGPGTTTVELPEDENLAVIVGANNAGKSNLLEALRLVLGGRRNWRPEPSDFFRLDVTEEMTVVLHLREPLPRGDAFNKQHEIAAFKLRAWQATRAPYKGQLRTQQRCLESDGREFNPPVKVGGSKLGKDVAQPQPVPPFRQVVSQLGPIHYLDPQMYRAFDPTGWGALARLLDVYREDFRSSANTYTVREGEDPIPRIEAFERLTAKMEEILATSKLTTIQESLTRNLGTFLGPGAEGAVIRVGLPSAEHLLANSLRLDAQDEQESPIVPVDRIGAGYRSVLRLAILRTYAEVAEDARRAVFLIEEPEAYLNPHLRRHFRAVVGELAEKGNDVILTTHDPALAPLTEYRCVVRLAKRDGATKSFRSKESLEFSYEAVAQKLRRGGNAEALFASKVILCEGQDDVAVVRMLLEGKVDLDARSISVLDCGGRDNLPDYIKLLDALLIDLFVVTDGDRTKAKKESSVAEQVQAVSDAAGDRLFLFEEDLETGLGTTKASRNNLAHVVSVTETLDLHSLPDDHEAKTLQMSALSFVSGGR